MQLGGMHSVPIDTMGLASYAPPRDTTGWKHNKITQHPGSQTIGTTSQPAVRQSGPRGGGYSERAALKSAHLGSDHALDSTILFFRYPLKRSRVTLKSLQSHYEGSILHPPPRRRCSLCTPAGRYRRYGRSFTQSDHLPILVITSTIHLRIPVFSDHFVFRDDGTLETFPSVIRGT